MNELYHHGTKGQKWGIRNGPPYPLDSEGKAKVRAQRDERNTGRKSGSFVTSFATAAALFTAYRLINDSSKFALASLKGRKINDSLNEKALKEKNDYLKYTQSKDGPILSLQFVDKFYKKSKPNPSKDEEIVNEQLKTNREGRTENCVNCSIAWEMRQRGYDVVSRSSNDALNPLDYDNLIHNAKNKNKPNFFNSDDRMDRHSDAYFNLTYKEGEHTSVTSKRNAKAIAKLDEEVDKDIRSMILENSGNNSRGYFKYDLHEYTLSHVINYEIKNNKVTFYDSQDPKRNMDKNIKKLYRDFDWEWGIHSMRLDNVELSEGDMQHVMTRK